MKKTLLWLACAFAALAVIGIGAYFVPPTARTAIAHALRKAYEHPSFGEFISATFGALTGSLSAFYLGFLQQRRDRRDQHHEAILAAQYALHSQWNILEGIRRQLLERFKSQPDRHLKIPVSGVSSEPAFVPFGQLIFIAKKDDADLLQDMRIAEDTYRACINALQRRNLLFKQLGKGPADIRHAFNPTSGKALIQADPEDVFLLKQITDELYKLVDMALQRLLLAFEKLQACTKRLFPKLGTLALAALDSERDLKRDTPEQRPQA